MNPSRWWLLPLAIALMIDAMLGLRLETSPGMVVSRAVLRTTSSGGCQASVLFRMLGLDNLVIIDTWSQGPKAESLAANNVQFAAAAGLLTPQSQAVISEGIEVTRDPVPQPPLKADYKSELHRGVTWLTGQCTPFSNPFRIRLRRLGRMGGPQGSYVVYRGILTNRPGVGPVPKADVWLGVRPDGRLGFELLRQIPTAPVDPGSLVTLEKVFTYPAAHLDALAKQSVPERTSFYQQEYHDLLVTMQQAEDLRPH